MSWKAAGRLPTTTSSAGRPPPAPSIRNVCVYVYVSACANVSVYSLFLTPDPGLRHRRTPHTAPPAMPAARRRGAAPSAAEGRPRLPRPAPGREGEGAGRERGHGEVRDGDRDGHGDASGVAAPLCWLRARVAVLQERFRGAAVAPRRGGGQAWPEAGLSEAGARYPFAVAAVPAVKPLPCPCRFCRFERLGKGFQTQSNFPAA